MARSPTSSGYDPVATRKSLVSAALELFGTKGFDATSVQEIADLAGVTKGALYHHFASKTELLRHIHDEYIDHQAAEVRQILDEVSDPSEQLVQLVRSFVFNVESFRNNVTVFFRERRYLTGEHLAAVRAKRDEAEQTLQHVIGRGMAQGVFRADVDPRTATLGIIGMCAWAAQWLHPDVATAEAVARDFSSIALEGLRKRD